MGVATKWLLTKASNVLRSTGIRMSEIRGALVVFCAGAMMYVGKDGMNKKISYLHLLTLSLPGFFVMVKGRVGSKKTFCVR